MLASTGGIYVVLHCVITFCQTSAMH